MVVNDKGSEGKEKGRQKSIVQADGGRSYSYVRRPGGWVRMRAPYLIGDATIPGGSARQ